MSNKIGNRPQTAPLTEFNNISLTAKPEIKSTFSGANAIESEISFNHETLSAEFNINQGDSLTSLVMFPDMGSSDASAPLPSALNPGFKSPAALRGERLIESLHLRQGIQSSGKGYQAFDYAVAKLSRDGKSLNAQELQTTLNTLQTRLRGLDNPTAAPLSADEVSQINASLKYVGLMTDGLQLYNLTNRAASAPGQPRRPTVCVPYEVNMLQDVCAALLESKGTIANNTLFEGPGKAPTASIKGFSAPTLDLSDSLIPDTESLTFRSNRFAAESPVIALSQKMSIYQDLIVSAESLIETGEKELTDLMGQQDQISGDLETAGQQTVLLEAKASQQQIILQDISDIYRLFPDGLPIVQTQAEVADINAKLSVLELKVELRADGQTRYLYQDQEISAAQFTQRFREGATEQTAILQDIHRDLSQTHRQVENLQQQSQQIGQRVQDLIDNKLTPARSQLETAHNLASENLISLYALRQDPQRWSALSPDEQSEVERMIRQNEKDLVKIQSLSQRGDHQRQRAESALRRAEELDAIADSLRNNLNRILSANQHVLSDPALKNALKAADLDAKVRALIEKADQLQSLSLTGSGGPNGVEQSRQWIEETKRLLQDAQQVHQTQQSTERQARIYLDRSLTILRENLNYHEHKLAQLHQHKGLE